MISVGLRSDASSLLETAPSDHVVVTPGENITLHAGYLRGHGTFVAEDMLVSSVAGVAQRVNKLVSVRPVRRRYKGEIGDVVVGRITSVGAKRWKVDIGAAQDAVLMLSSVVLPGGVQRRRTAADQLQMRDFFVEGDLISAEVQNFFNDGAISLHTRSLKYGKLENGQLSTMPGVLIKRLSQHFVQLPCGVSALLGLNGYVWLTVEATQQDGEDNISSRVATAEQVEQRRKTHAARTLSASEREQISRVANVLQILQQKFLSISPDTISQLYTLSQTLGLASKDILTPQNTQLLLARAKRSGAEEEGDAMQTE